MTTLFTKKNEVDFLQLLIRAAENALQTAQLFRTAMMGDKPPIEYVKAIHDLEHAGDSITHEIFKGLNKVFITPIDREDIMVLASKVDDVTDGIEATIARFDYLVCFPYRFLYERIFCCHCRLLPAYAGCVQASGEEKIHANS